MSSRSLLICQGRILLPEGEFPRVQKTVRLVYQKRQFFATIKGKTEDFEDQNPTSLKSLF